MMTTLRIWQSSVYSSVMARFIQPKMEAASRMFMKDLWPLIQYAISLPLHVIPSGSVDAVKAASGRVGPYRRWHSLDYDHMVSKLSYCTGLYIWQLCPWNIWKNLSRFWEMQICDCLLFTVSIHFVKCYNIWVTNSDLLLIFENLVYDIII